nr:DUF3987 domain-containing protein [uncultured Roseococcus sp.]
MNTHAPLAPDGAQIAQFVEAIFRYADAGTYVSLRAFHELEHKVFFLTAAPVGDDLTALSDAATRGARRAANNPEPAVFCPPLATFSNAQQAREVDLANGLALSVECDQTPQNARLKLEALLGPATVVVSSGGEWMDPDTGEIQPKLHLHWRLTEPTREAVDHTSLKRARRLAMLLVGGDHSNVPMVHPIRWPGSWHRKKSPRLARIDNLSDDAEIELGEVLEKLIEAVRAAGIDENASGSGKRASGSGGIEDGLGEARETAALVQAILKGDDYHGPIATLSMRFLKGGMPDPQVVLTLRGMMLAVPEAIRDLKDGSQQLFRWQSRYDDIPRAVSTARAKLGERPAATRKSESPGGEWPDPIDFLNDPDAGLDGRVRPEHLPEALAGFVFDTAARMGTDPSSVAIFSIVACASVVTDDWAVQPKVYDDTWTENPRLWAGVVAPPSFLKSPVLKACTAPIDRMDAEARREHANAMKRWQGECDKLKEAGAPKSEYPAQPKLERWLVEGTTMEALTEILRDDFQSTQIAPAAKVLVRQDEMAGWIGDMDRYKAGGKGGGDRGHYLKLFNGGRAVIDRIGRGSFAVPNWSACIVGGIQPEPIQRIARDADDDGLLQRFLFCLPSSQTSGEDRKPNQQALARYRALFPALAALRPATTMDGGHQVVVLHSEAQQRRAEINEILMVQAAWPDATPRLKAALAKWPGIFARLALTFHLIEIADCRARHVDAPVLNVLTPEAAQKAASYMEQVLLPHMLRAEALLFLTPQTGHARWIAGFILSNEEVAETARITMRAVTRAYGPLRAPEHHRELRAVMQSLETMGWLEPEPPSNAAKEVSAWQVNPKLATVFAEQAEAERMRRKRAQKEMGETIRQKQRRRAS